MVAGINLRDVRDVVVDGVGGKEGTLAASTSHAIVRGLPVGHGMCMIIAEYPARFERDVEGDARRFVDSFTLGSFRG